MGCQVPHTHFMLRPSQTPDPHVVQGAEQAVPACGRMAGQAAAAGAEQVRPAAVHEQSPSGYRQASCPLGAEAQAFWPPDIASANEAGQPDGRVVGHSGPLEVTVYQPP